MSARRAAWIRSVEALSVGAFAWLWTRAGVELAAAAAERPGLVPLALPGCALALLAADFASGFVHWACDRHFDERAPILGPLVVRTFREHHADPQALVRHGFVELNGDSALALLPFLAALALAPPAASGALAFAGHAALLAFALAILLTNCVHRWAHAPRVPRAVAALQRRGLLLRPDAHAAHHRGDHGRAFCITTGWLNPALDASGFFPALEARLARLRGPRTRTRNG